MGMMDDNMSTHMQHGVNMSSHLGHGMNMSSHMGQGMNMSSHMGHGVNMSTHMTHGVNMSSHMGHGMNMSSHMGHDTSGGNHMMGHGSHNLGDTRIHENGTLTGLHMNMFFHSEDVYLLFESWEVSSIGTLIGSLIGVLILATLYEGIKSLRLHLLNRAAVHMYRSSANLRKYVGGRNQKFYPSDEVGVRPMSKAILSLSHLLQVLLHVLQVLSSYCLMLIFMTYNVWMCIGVVIGAGIGYLLFGWSKNVVVDITEHCH